MPQIDLVFETQCAKIGQEIGLSDWLLIDQAMIDKFADVTMDHQFIHIDPERAAMETPFGGTIAHGFLTLSLGSKFAGDCFEGLPGQAMSFNYGFDKLRFLAPVRAGARIRGRFSLMDVTRKSDTQLLQKIQLTIEIESEDTPALIAEWLGMAIFA